MTTKTAVEEKKSLDSNQMSQQDAQAVKLSKMRKKLESLQSWEGKKGYKLSKGIHITICVLTAVFCIANLIQPSGVLLIILSSLWALMLANVFGMFAFDKIARSKIKKLKAEISQEEEKLFLLAAEDLRMDKEVDYLDFQTIDDLKDRYTKESFRYRQDSPDMELVEEKLSLIQQMIERLSSSKSEFYYHPDSTPIVITSEDNDIPVDSHKGPGQESSDLIVRN